MNHTSINSNQNHDNIIQLPDWILHRILSQVSNSDKVCVALTCKSLFTRLKDKLWFTWSKYNDINSATKFRLNSFLPSFQQSRQGCYEISTLQQLIDLKEDLERLPIETTIDTEPEFKWEEWISTPKINRKYFLNPKNSTVRNTIVFSQQFREYIPPGTIPRHIKYIEFGRFNQPIDHPDILPPNLHTLSFRGSFDQVIQPGILPSTLKCLLMSYAYNSPLAKGALPEGLEILIFDSEFQQTLCGGILPTSLKVLVLRGLHHPLTIYDLPEGLEVFHVKSENGIVANQLQDYSIPIPKKCKFLHLDKKVLYQLTSIPSGMVEIRHFPTSYLHLVPSTVTKLSLYGEEIDWSKLPPNLVKLTVFNCPVVNYDPTHTPHLTQLTFGPSREMENNENFPIPPTIKKLVLRSNIDGVLDRLPPNLEVIYLFNDTSIQDFFKVNLPPLLKCVKFFAELESGDIVIPPSIEYVERWAANFTTYMISNPPSTPYSERILTQVDNHVKVKDLLHVSLIKFEPFHFEIRRLSEWSILVLSNTQVSCGIYTFTLDDLEKPCRPILLKK